jgi:hypothetical protein
MPRTLIGIFNIGGAAVRAGWSSIHGIEDLPNYGNFDLWKWTHSFCYWLTLWQVTYHEQLICIWSRKSLLWIEIIRVEHERIIFNKNLETFAERNISAACALLFFSYILNWWLSLQKCIEHASIWNVISHIFHNTHYASKVFLKPAYNLS